MDSPLSYQNALLTCQPTLYLPQMETCQWLFIPSRAGRAQTHCPLSKASTSLPDLVLVCFSRLTCLHPKPSPRPVVRNTFYALTWGIPSVPSLFSGSLCLEFLLYRMSFSPSYSTVMASNDHAY